jgi:hypothetical protein
MFYHLILWHMDPLLGNKSVNTFPWEPTHATIGHLLLGNESVNTPKIIWDNRRWCILLGSLWGCITRSSKGAVSCCQKLRQFSWGRVHFSQLLSRIRSSSGDGSWRWFRRNSKKGIGFKWRRYMWFEVTMRVLKIRCLDTTSEGWES